MKIFSYWLFISLSLVIVLINFGQPIWCNCHSLSLWVNDVNSSHNSQHLLDPYSFSHLQHGFFFYFILRLIFKKSLSFELIFIIGMFLESSWEILENTDFIIDRYRTETIALNYHGDSVLNSIGDLLSCMFGIFLAYRLPIKLSFAICIITEIVMLFTIKDSLLLNVLMLTYPLEAVKNWQK